MLQYQYVIILHSKDWSLQHENVKKEKVKFMNFKISFGTSTYVKEKLVNIKVST